MKIISKAPHRICLIGGGSDVNPYASEHQGAIINVAINKYIVASLIPRDDNKILINTLGKLREFSIKDDFTPGIDKSFDLVRAIIDEFKSDLPSGFALTIESDISDSSGLGSSGVCGVVVTGALNHWLNKGMSKHDIAKFAYEIETQKLKWAGGKQDQWAAAYGGLNFNLYGKGENVKVEPFNLDQDKFQELKKWILLVYTGGHRSSSNIQESLQGGMDSESQRFQAFEILKNITHEAKPYFNSLNFEKLGKLFDQGWQAKKQSNPIVTNERIDMLYEIAINNGALGGKLIGAGQSGYFFFLTPPQKQDKVIKDLEKQACININYNFDFDGLTVRQN